MEYKALYQKWLAYDGLDREMRAELEALSDAEIRERFYAPLAFGTAGLRGIMGAGVNRMNLYTVSQTTQGLADVLSALDGGAAAQGVAISYDCRENSERFARAAAAIMAANGIKTYLFDGMRPTPELSFAVRACHCAAGINITASHNPKEYNGYKVGATAHRLTTRSPRASRRLWLSWISSQASPPWISKPQYPKGKSRCWEQRRTRRSSPPCSPAS